MIEKVKEIWEGLPLWGKIAGGAVSAVIAVVILLTVKNKFFKKWKI